MECHRSANVRVMVKQGGSEMAENDFTKLVNVMHPRCQPSLPGRCCYPACRFHVPGRPLDFQVCVCLLLKYILLLQRCSRGGRGIVDDTADQCATTNDEPRTAWTSLPITVGDALVNTGVPVWSHGGFGLWSQVFKESLYRGILKVLRRCQQDARSPSQRSS